MGRAVCVIEMGTSVKQDEIGPRYAYLCCINVQNRVRWEDGEHCHSLWALCCLCVTYQRDDTGENPVQIGHESDCQRCLANVKQEVAELQPCK